MAETNGHDSTADTSDRRLLQEGHTTFRIGSKDISVPPLTFWTLEARDSELKMTDQSTTVREYADAVLMIIATSIEVDKLGGEADPEAEAIEKTYARFKRRITFGEMKQLSPNMNKLLLNSGYEATPLGEAQGASPGTETSTDSSQTSLPTESAEATPAESSAH
jgi:hypothetical protein